MNKLVGLSALLMIATSAISAAGVGKVATVDLKQLFDESSKTKAEQEKVKLLQQKVADLNNQKLKEIRKIAAEIKVISDKLNQDLVAEERKQLRSERTAIANKGNQVENDRRSWLNKENKSIDAYIVKSMRDIMKELQEGVNQYAKENSIKLILDSSALGTTQTKFVVYDDPRMDVTEAISKKLKAAQ